MPLTLTGYTSPVWERIASWYEDPPPSHPHAVCCNRDGSLAGAIGYHLADGNLLIVATEYIDPSLGQKDKARVHDYMCKAVKHLATMSGRYPVVLQGPFIAKKTDDWEGW